MASFRKRLGVEIARIRKDKDWSQRILERRAGVSLPTIQNLEYGLTRTSLINVCKICRGLEINVVELLGDVGTQDAADD